MSPRELYYALKAKMEVMEMEMEYSRKLQHIVARYQAALLLTPHFKKPIDDPRELGRFSWEAPVVQTVEQMKRALLGIAKAQNKKVKKDGTRTSRRRRG